MGAPALKTKFSYRIKVLLVEDDPVVGQLVFELLQTEGYGVEWCESVSSARHAIEGSEFHLIVLDVNLPDGNGFELCKEWRSDGYQTPVLMLTSRGDEESLVKGLSIGGNDYLRKPFGNRELLARVNLQLRGKRGRLTAGALSLDLDKKKAEIDAKPMKLTPTEFEILASLVQHLGDDVQRESLLRGIDSEVQLEDRTLDSHISHLRKKLLTASGGKITLVAAYGVGYRLLLD